MRERCSILRVAVILGVSTSARAEETTPATATTRAPVRLDASSLVVLERIDDGGNATVVCRAPCDQPLDLGAPYRINGDGIRPSSHFRLQPDAMTITTSTKSSAGYTAGIVLLTVSGAFLVAGVVTAGALMALSSGGPFQGVGAAFFSTPMFAVSLATGIPGTVLLANHYQSTASALPTPHAMRSVTVPIVSLSF